MNDSKQTLELEWTGERYVPQIRGTIALEHLHRYAFASEHVAGKVVLDMASGEGYGSEMLSRTAKHVYGVDIDEASVKHAQQNYKAENLEYHLGSCTEIPLPDASVDVVVSFETIEHITDHESMMREVKRVLRPG
jgi:ubiquinone/menaquinone biosynthesis C-methylase UbiE